MLEHIEPVQVVLQADGVDRKTEREALIFRHSFQNACERLAPLPWSAIEFAVEIGRRNLNPDYFWTEN